MARYPDNDPPGPATAYDCGRGFQAGGTGTYADPLTFASAPGEFNQCEIIYDPYTKKYLRFEDFCAQCDTDWKASPRINHIDLWTGSTTVNGGQEQIQCENDLTPAERSQTIVRQPSQNLPVDSKSRAITRLWEEADMRYQRPNCTSKVPARPAEPVTSSPVTTLETIARPHRVFSRVQESQCDSFDGLGNFTVISVS